MRGLDQLRDEVSEKVFNAMFETFVNGKLGEEDGWADSVLGGLSQGLDSFFQASPTLNSSFISDRPLDFPNRIFKLLGLNSSNSGFGSPLFEVKRKILLEADKFVRSSQQGRAAREQTERENKQKSVQLIKDVISNCKSILSLDELDYSTTFVGGLSGSQVLRVHLKKAGTPKKLGVLKFTTSNKDFEAEKAGLNAVSSCWISEFCDPSFAEAIFEIDGDTYYVLITSLAFPPSTYSPEIPTLHDIVCDDRNKARATKVINVFAKKYSELCSTECDVKSHSRVNYCQKLLSRWPILIDKFGDPDFWFPVGLPTKEECHFSDNEGVFRNPINVFAEMNLIDEGMFKFKYSHQHGDLNARNILLCKEQQATEKPALIDFEKSANAESLLDPCYLSLFLLEASRPPNSAFANDLNGLHRSFVNTICTKSGSGVDHGTWQFGLECSKLLFGKIWANAKTPEEVNELTLQVHLTLSITALARCYYEVKALHAGKKNSLAETTLLARLFFRISAAALEPYVLRDESIAPVTNVSNDLRDLVERL